MWPNLKETTILVTFTREIRNVQYYFLIFLNFLLESDILMCRNMQSSQWRYGFAGQS